jgi:hypothetical protein
VLGEYLPQLTNVKGIPEFIPDMKDIEKNTMTAAI